MPLLFDQQLEEGTIGRIPEALPEPEGPSALDTLAASSRQANLAGAAYDVLSDGITRPDHVTEGYDPYDDVAGFEAHAHRFVDSDSPEETAYIKQRISMEEKDRQTIAQAGGWGFAASLASGVTDPATLASMMVPVAGPTRLSTIGRTVAASIAFDSTAELAFHGLQESRTVGESVFNVGAGALLSGVFGAAISPRIPVEDLDALRREFNAAMNETAEAAAPPVAEGMVRVYHGGSPEGVDGPLWVTSYLPDAEGWAARHPDMRVWYVDVPKETLGGDMANGIPPLSRIELPAELASNRKLLPEAALSGAERERIKASGKSANVEGILRGSAVPGTRLSNAVDRMVSAVDGVRRAAHSVKAALTKAPDIDLNDAKAVSKVTGDKAVSISAFIRQTGGILDDGGELAARDVTNKNAPGLVRKANADGKADMDAVRERLFDAGYFPEKSTYDEISDSDIFDAIAADLSGQKVWPHAVREKLTRVHEARDLSDYWGQYGINADSPVEDIERVLRDFDDEARHAALSDERIAEDAAAFDEFMASLDIYGEVESTAGAAAAGATTAAQETLATGGGWLGRTLGKISPALRLLNSPSIEARRLVQQLAETTELLTKNFEGIVTPTAIETMLKRMQGSWWQAYQGRAELFRAYRKRLSQEGAQAGTTGAPITTLSRRQFNEEIAFAMRRGDQHQIPEIAQAAARTRELVFEPLKKRAQKLGLLPEGDLLQNTAMSYLMRQYNVAKIRRDQTAWIRTLAEGFQRQGVDALEALDIAHKVTRNILGSERGTLDLHIMDDIVPESGRLKSRTLLLPDDVLEPWLVNDIDALTQAYIRSLGPEVEITERFGDREMKEAFQKITDEYAVRKTRAVALKDDKALKAMAKAEADDLRDLAAIRDRLYGSFGAPKDPSSFFVRAGRTIRAVNFMRMLGGQVISAMTDTARIMMIYGAPKMAGSALKLATNVRALKLARSEARRMGVGLDLVLNTRGIALGDIGEYSTHAEQAFLRRASDVFSVASLQSPWNAVMKSWASVMTQDDILRAAGKIAKGQKLSKFQAARMASLGLDDTVLERIAEEAATKGSKHQGLAFANSDTWADQSAARVFEAAVLREADTAVLTPGVGDLPLVYSTEWGKALLQFKSFAISSVRRLQIPAAQGLAKGDLATMTGVAASFGLGSLVYTLKQLAADQPITEEPHRFALEMVDKSGLMAWSGDVLFPGVWQFGSDDFSRWSDRQPVETLLGPVAGTIADAYTSRWPKRLLDGDVDEKDVHKLRRLLPGQNLFYLRRGINALEEQVAD